MKSILALTICITFSHPHAHSQTGVTDKEILIGESIDLTTQASARTKGLLEGQKLVFDKINKNGGIHGRKIKLIVYDDLYNPEKTLENTKKLLNEDKVFLLFKYYGTPTIKAALSYIEEKDSILMAPSSGAEFLRSPPNKNVFVTRGGFYKEADEMIDFVVNKLGKKKIAIFYQDDSFGNEGRNGSLKTLKTYNLDYVAQGAYERNTRKVADAYKILKEAHPEVILLWSISQPAIELLKLAAADNWNPIFIGGTALLSNEFLDASKEHKRNLYLAPQLPLLETSKLPIIQSYLKDAKEANLVPDNISLEGYLDAQLLVTALQKTGKNLTREEFRNTLKTKLTKEKIGGIKIQYSKDNHQAFDISSIIQIDSGKIKATQH